MSCHPTETPPHTPPYTPAFQPGFWWGAWLSLLLIVPLSALGYLASRFVALPFVPFSLFDWLARALPGSLVTAGIDALVRVLRLLELPLADTAKVADRPSRG